ncbi:unnamed protein product, partial [Amoebophrya sp. A25]|eukprot:GSA25T00003158001.1
MPGKGSTMQPGGGAPGNIIAGAGGMKGGPLQKGGKPGTTVGGGKPGKGNKGGKPRPPPSMLKKGGVYRAEEITLAEGINPDDLRKSDDNKNKKSDVKALQLRPFASKGQKQLVNLTSARLPHTISPGKTVKKAAVERDRRRRKILAAFHVFRPELDLCEDSSAMWFAKSEGMRR